MKEKKEEEQEKMGRRRSKKSKEQDEQSKRAKMNKRRRRERERGRGRVTDLFDLLLRVALFVDTLRLLYAEADYGGGVFVSLAQPLYRLLRHAIAAPLLCFI